jgi:hypothetical protein
LAIAYKRIKNFCLTGKPKELVPELAIVQYPITSVFKANLKESIHRANAKMGNQSENYGRGPWISLPGDQLAVPPAPTIQ